MNPMRATRFLGWSLGALVALCAPEALAQAAEEANEAGSGTLQSLTGLDGGNMALPLRALFLVTVFGIVPSIALLTTCFPRIVIVLSFLRRALGTQDLPPNMVVFGLSLLLTATIMLPVWKEVHADAYVPLAETKEISLSEALTRAEAPLKRFMLAHTFRSDLRLFVDIAGAEGEDTNGTSAAPQRLDDLNFFVVFPAFVLSELKTAFRIGFLLFLPFLLIDLVVSAVLVSMGMFMLPPTLVSLPLKILVFVLVDGWTLVVSQLAQGLQGVT